MFRNRQNLRAGQKSCVTVTWQDLNSTFWFKAPKTNTDTIRAESTISEGCEAFWRSIRSDSDMNRIVSLSNKISNKQLFLRPAHWLEIAIYWQAEFCGKQSKKCFSFADHLVDRLFDWRPTGSDIHPITRSRYHASSLSKLDTNWLPRLCASHWLGLARNAKIRFQKTFLLWPAVGIMLHFRLWLWEGSNIGCLSIFQRNAEGFPCRKNTFQNFKIQIWVHLEQNRKIWKQSGSWEARFDR